MECFQKRNKDNRREFPTRDSDQRIIVSTKNSISLKRVVTSDDGSDQGKKGERKVSINRVNYNQDYERRRRHSSSGSYRQY